MRILILLAVTVLALPFRASSAARVDSLLKVLRTELAKKAQYDGHRNQLIDSQKNVLNHATNLADKYEVTAALFRLYRDYRFDTTFQYATQLVELSTQMKDARRLAESRLRLSTTLIAAGMIKETFDCLKEIEPKLLDNELKKEYYLLHSWANSDLAKYNSDAFYTPSDLSQKFAYLDSAIALTKPGSFEQLILLAQQNEGVGQQPQRYYVELLKRNLSLHEEAMVSTGLSGYREGNEKIALLATAAIDDVRTSTYRAQAMFDLGNALFEQNRVEEAYFFLQQALAQADRFGSRLQRYQVTRILPIVAAKRDLLVQQERQNFYIMIACIVVVALLTGLICFIIFVQLKKVKAGEVTILQSNHTLAEKNRLLWEEGRIKEEYIGFFFSELSRYILKLDKLKKNVQRKAKSGGNAGEISNLLDSVDIDSERNQLFLTFDRIFLKLFPGFINSFNSLLSEEDQIIPKTADSLTAHLRIFALLRLGVDNNETIASILGYSINTVYTYRFRMRSKALVPAETFEQYVIGIELAV